MTDITEQIADILDRSDYGTRFGFERDESIALAAAVVKELGMVKQYGLQYDKYPIDVKFGRKENPDGTITSVIKMDDEKHARVVSESPVPRDAINKHVVYWYTTKVVRDE